MKTNKQRGPVVIGLFAFFALTTGCSSLQEPSRIPDPDQAIVISLQTRSEKVTWELRKGEPGKGTIAGSVISPTPPPNFESPPEAFEECRRLIESIGFMEMATPFNHSAELTASISVSCKGRSNNVDVTRQTKPPEGFADLQKFLEALPKRSKAISPSP